MLERAPPSNQYPPFDMKYFTSEIAHSSKFDIYIAISLKTSNILENKSQVFQRSDCTIA